MFLSQFSQRDLILAHEKDVFIQCVGAVVNNKVLLHFSECPLHQLISGKTTDIDVKFLVDQALNLDLGIKKIFKQFIYFFTDSLSFA